MQTSEHAMMSSVDLAWMRRLLKTFKIIDIHQAGEV